jgi:hypothetical protein
LIAAPALQETAPAEEIQKGASNAAWHSGHAQADEGAIRPNISTAAVAAASRLRRDEPFKGIAP